MSLRIDDPKAVAANTVQSQYFIQFIVCYSL